MKLSYYNFSDKILNEAISWFYLYRPPPVHNFIRFVSNQKKPEVKKFLKIEDIFESIVYIDIIIGFYMRVSCSSKQKHKYSPFRRQIK